MVTRLLTSRTFPVAVALVSAAALSACAPRSAAPDPSPGGCVSGPDCSSGVCVGGTCAQPSCADGVRNGDETDVDCGGSCGACADGKVCAVPPDCASGVCSNGTCGAPSCTDGVRNGDELGVDCGGSSCAPCAIGTGCTSGADCASGVCLDGACECGDASAVYVSAATGNDANRGTAGTPLRTIQAAVACASQIPREIRVAEGVYEASGSSPVVLVEGRSLVGGWAADFGTRSPAEHRTEIRDTTDTGTTGTGVAVQVSSSSAATVLEGFTIQATTTGAGIRATAIAVAPVHGEPAGATIRDNAIACGGNPGILLARCIDLGTSGGTIVVANNTIALGTSDPAAGTSSGIQGYGVSAASIEGNTLEGGSSSAIVPIELWVSPGAAPVVAGNDVRPGPGAEVGVRVQLMSAAATPAIRNNVIVVPGGAIGIDDRAGAEISNNTVVAATGTGIRTGLAGASIRNNAVVAEPAGTCIAETSAPALPTAVQNDDLFGCAAVYVDGATGLPLSLAELNARTGAAANLSADPALDPAAGYRPRAGSPLLGAGLDLSSLFQTDKSGAVRAPPWSIGAYQGP